MRVVRDRRARRRAAGRFARTVACLTVLVALEAPGRAGADAREAPGAWYPVWSAVLAHGLDAAAASVLIVNETVTAPWASVPVNEGRIENPDVEPFRPAPLPPGSATAFTISDKFVLDRPYVLMDRKTLDTLFDVGPKDGWHIFFARFPDVPGIIGLSPVRFTGDGEEATVYLSFGCGPACGAGRVIYLKRRPSLDWQVQDSELVWIAAE